LIFGTIFLVIASLALVYTWLGYPALLWALRQVCGRSLIREKCDSTFSLIVAVYNEEAHIAAKLEDCLALQYPRGHLEILVASDGSTDSTERIVEEFAERDSRIRLLRSSGRSGKSGVQNLAAAHARGEILLFTDAETRTRPNLLELLAENFADPRVGLVAPTVHFGKFEDAISQGQGAYWRFELFLRQLESDLGILATASGAALAVRRALYRPLPSEYGDDCVIPLDVRLQGYRVIQDARIVVSDEMPHTIEGEVRVRVRMTARNWAGMLNRPGLLNPLRFPGTAWGLVSHKLLRWLTPFLLAALFLVNGLLVVHGEMRLFFLLQSGFYVAAFVGWRRSLRQPCERIFGYPFAFCLANLGFLLGIVKCLRAQRIIAYK
jgi:cellulose synthase/poly-beta-1,6-N-acetylglucosamine synthase-like glycosyltransferase